MYHHDARPICGKICYIIHLLKSRLKMILSYLGSKSSMLPNIDSIIGPLLTPTTTFCDLFLGTGCVANHYKNKMHSIVGCDTEMYSYVLSRALLKCEFSPKLGKCIDVLNELCCSPKNEGIVTQIFSKEHLFFSLENALRIDFIRNSLNDLHKSGFLSYSEFIFLLASLLKTVSKFANTTGTFRTHLKQLGKRATKPLKLEPIHRDMNINSKCKIQRCDSISFVRSMKPVDIVYLDPPYSSMHYSAYYSFLNYLCLYDKKTELVGPGIIKGYYKSKFGIVKTAYNEIKLLLDLLCKKTKCIIVSYSSKGTLHISVLCNLLKSYGSINVNRFPYKKYQSNKVSTIKKHDLFEYVIVVNV